VLIVDDNRDGIESVAALFELEGHLTDIGERAGSTGPRFGLPARRGVAGHLPGMDGYEVARRRSRGWQRVASPSVRGATLRWSQQSRALQ